MKQPLTASVTKDGDWYVAQCSEVDVASQGETVENALANLREAIELRVKPPTATLRLEIRPMEVEVSTA